MRFFSSVLSLFTLGKKPFWTTISRKEGFFLGLILFLAFFLRFYHLTSLPLAVHHDELVNAYIGRFIFENGKDLRGNSWPILYFDKFGDYPPVLPMYLSGFATFLFGMSEFAIRFPAALLGALTVIPVYILARVLLGNRAVSLFAAFFFAIIPWHIVLSRASAEGAIALFVFLSALTMLLTGLQKDDKKLGIASLVLFALSYLMYPSFRILSPLVLLPLPFVFSEKKQRRFLLCAIAFLIFLTGAIATTGWGRARLAQTSVLKNGDVMVRIEAFQRDEGQNNVFVARVFHNKVTGYPREFMRQYFTYFSPEYLFIKGGYEALVYIVPDIGVIYVIFGVLVLVALLQTTQKNRLFYYVLYLLIIAPLPAALTSDYAPNTHRSIFMTIPLVLLAGHGFYKIFSGLRNGKPYQYVVSGLVILILFAEFIYFYHQYMNHTSAYKSVFKDQGNKELTMFFLENKNNYDRIISYKGDHLPLFYLFYNGDFNRKYSNLDKKVELSDLITDIDMIHFTKDECPSAKFRVGQTPEKVLIVDYGNCKVPKRGFDEVQTIYRKDSTLAFRLLTPQSH